MNDIPNTALEMLRGLVSSTGSGEKVKIKLPVPCHHTLATHKNEKSCFQLCSGSEYRDCVTPYKSYEHVALFPSNTVNAHTCTYINFLCMCVYI